MKVRRLREENASRARELWMKAQSAAAGQKIRDKKMLAAAIKIQVFGYTMGTSVAFHTWAPTL